MERENVTLVMDIFTEYYYAIQDYERDAEAQAMFHSLSLRADGPYVWMFSVAQPQGFDDYEQAFAYHCEENKKIQLHVEQLFNYLYILAVTNVSNGYSSSDNHWNVYN